MTFSLTDPWLLPRLRRNNQGIDHIQSADASFLTDCGMRSKVKGRPFPVAAVALRRRFEPRRAFTHLRKCGITVENHIQANYRRTVTVCESAFWLPGELK